MPRKPAAPQPELPFDVTSRSTAVVQETTTVVPNPARKMGRPRKWESEAERKRAYRERRAADLAEPEQLRRSFETPTVESPIETAGWPTRSANWPAPRPR